MQYGASEEQLRHRSIQFEGRLHVTTAQRIKGGWVVRLRPWGVDEPPRFEVTSRLLLDALDYLDGRIAEAQA